MDLVNFAEPLAKYIAAAVALGTLLKGVIEFSTQNKIKKYEKYRELRVEFRTSAEFLEMRTLLEREDAQIGSVTYEKKVRFLGFYEDISILIKNDILSEDLAYYMFGYYAIRCYRSTVFWEEIDKSSIYWKEFVQFAERMIFIEDEVTNNRRELKLTY
jgi:hypothetical protein